MPKKTDQPKVLTDEQKRWRGDGFTRRERGNPYAATETERQRLEKTSPFLNGDATPKQPKTLRRHKTQRRVGVVTSASGSLLFKVALPCMHWAYDNGECRQHCDAWQERGGVPKRRTLGHDKSCCGGLQIGLESMTRRAS